MSRLPGQSLMILDRATMAYSLESRSPFLDPRFAEFMARVPVSLKMRGPRRLRYLERRLGERYLPPRGAASGRSRASPPRSCTSWKTRSARWRHDCCLRASWCATGISRGAVRQLVEEHLARRRDHGNRIWLLLSAEVWYRRYVCGRSTMDLEAEIAEKRSHVVLERAG